MTRSALTWAVLCAGLAACLMVVSADGPDGAPAEPWAPRASSLVATQPEATVGVAALRFVPNAGQTSDEFLWEVRRPGGSFAFAHDGIAFSVAAGGDAIARFGMRFEGTTGVRPRRERDASGVINYLIGNDPAAWITGLRPAAAVRYRNLYPGVDLVYDSTDDRLKGTWHLAAGVDPRVIRWRWCGIDGASVEPGGDLLLEIVDATSSAAVTVRERAPVAWQTVGGRRVSVPVRFVVEGDEMSFRVGDHDGSLPLVIDPEIIFSTLLGGNGTDHILGVDSDAAGNVYTTGRTHSTLVGGGPEWPILNPVFLYGGEIADAFVTKMDERGEGLVYSTYVGGGDPNNFQVTGGADWGLDIHVDDTGSATITGLTESLNFPTTTNAIHTNKIGGNTDAFIARIDPTGSSLAYGTYIGGTLGDYGWAIDRNRNGDHVIAGYTTGGQTHTPGALQPFFSGMEDGFFAVVSETAGVTYSSYFGFPGTEVLLSAAVDSDDHIILAGYTTSNVNALAFLPPGVIPPQPVPAGMQDAFVVKIDPAGNGQTDVRYFTYLGGTSVEEVYGVAVDEEDDIYVVGTTASTDFPTTVNSPPYLGGLTDGFVTRISPDGAGPVDISYSVFVGDIDYDVVFDIEIENGHAFVCGLITLGHAEGFVMKLNPSGSPLGIFPFGGPSFDIAFAIDATPDFVTVVGATKCENFATQNPCPVGFPVLRAFQPLYGGGTTDGFIRRYEHF